MAFYAPKINLDGWIPISATCTYASATTFTIAGDVTAKFPTGTKLKLTQTTAKYFYVVSSSYGAPNTTVTVTGGTDYTLANAAITSPFYSYQANPQAFPQWFNYTPTWTGTGGTPAVNNGTLQAQFNVVGRMCTFQIKLIWGNTTTANAATENRFSLPITGATIFTGVAVNAIGTSLLFDQNVPKIWVGTTDQVSTTSVGTYPEATASSVSVGATVPFTWTTSDAWSLEGSYEI